MRYALSIHENTISFWFKHFSAANRKLEEGISYLNLFPVVGGHFLTSGLVQFHSIPPGYGYSQFAFTAKIAERCKVTLLQSFRRREVGYNCKWWLAP